MRGKNLPVAIIYFTIMSKQCHFRGGKNSIVRGKNSKKWNQIQIERENSKSGTKFTKSGTKFVKSDTQYYNR